MQDLIARTRELFAAGAALPRAWTPPCASISTCFSRGGSGRARCHRTDGLQHARTSSGHRRTWRASSCWAGQWRGRIAAPFASATPDQPAGARASSARISMTETAEPALRCPMQMRLPARHAGRGANESCGRMRNAAGWRARPPATFITRFTCCQPRSATLCARCMPSCGWWMTCRTTRSRPKLRTTKLRKKRLAANSMGSRKNEAGSRNGACCLTGRSLATPERIRFCRRLRTRSTATGFRRVIFTI